MCTFPDHRVAFCAYTGVLLVFGWLWYGLWFLVVGLFLVLGGLWCGLLGCWVGCVGVSSYTWMLFVVVFCIGVAVVDCLQDYLDFCSSFHQRLGGPLWRCLQWVLDVWFVWFSHNSTGRVLVFRLPFHTVCTLGLGTSFLVGFDIEHSGSGFKYCVYFVSCEGFHIFQFISQVPLVFFECCYNFVCDFFLAGLIVGC